MLAASALLALGLPPFALAADLFVGPGSSGAPFQSIGAAVQAAQAGDVIFVAPGAYTETATVVIDKPLTLLGSGHTNTRLSGLPGFPGEIPVPLVIQNLGPGAEVRVVGIKLRSVPDFGEGLTAVRITSCLGPVVLADVESLGGGGFTTGQGIAVIEGSSQVLLDDCTFVAGASFTSAVAGENALFVQSSDVHVNGCTLVGGDGNYVAAYGTKQGGNGIQAFGSTVRLSRSIVFGGHGGGNTPIGPVPGPAGNGGAAVLASNSSVLVRGGSGNGLFGGAGGVATGSAVPSLGLGASAVDVSFGSTATTTPDAVLQAGANGGGGVTAPAVLSVGGVWTQLPEARATLGVLPKRASLGAKASLSLGGPPSAVALTFLSFGQGVGLGLPGFPGQIVLPLGASLALAPVSLGASGVASLLVPIPSFPALVGKSLVLQQLAVGPAGAQSVSAPALVAIVP